MGRRLEVTEILTPLCSCDHGDGTWTLTNDLIFRLSDERLYKVPKGFNCDGASVPRIFWPLYPPVGTRYSPAAWIHDYLYRLGGKLLPLSAGYRVPARTLTRAQADRFFLSAMAARHVPRPRRLLLWLVVRLCGWLPWSRARQVRACSHLDPISSRLLLLMILYIIAILAALCLFTGCVSLEVCGEKNGVRACVSYTHKAAVPFKLRAEKNF